MTEAIETFFEFFAENPPTAMIVGGILFVLLSILTAPFDSGTTEFLRNLAIWMIVGGAILQLLWLILRER
ncbi:MAG: hypothetical protein QXQ94_11510 [Candidatus Bathyarchaeia archaeon]